MSLRDQGRFVRSAQLSVSVAGETVRNCRRSDDTGPRRLQTSVYVTDALWSEAKIDLGETQSESQSGCRAKAAAYSWMGSSLVPAIWLTDHFDAEELRRNLGCLVGTVATT